MLEELKALIKTPRLWVTMIGVALIPSLYNLSFLGSMWNPYGRLDDLPVAVVNHDKPGTLNDKKIAIGDKMVTIIWSLICQKTFQKKHQHS